MSGKIERNDPYQIMDEFQIQGRVKIITPFGSGHINRTFKVLTADAEDPNYLLQKINHFVFTRPDQVQQNIQKITQFITNKIQERFKDEVDFQILSVIPTKSGEYFFYSPFGEYWRLYPFIEKSYSYDTVKNQTQAFQAGKIFGFFDKILIDFPSSTLFQSIPNFHNLSYRLNQFEEGLKADPVKRKGLIGPEIQFIKKNYKKFLHIHDLCKQGKIPYRTTHNDTKFNNILFNQDDIAISVVDLDTTMQGLTLYDYGDAIRSITYVAPEDTEHVLDVNLDLKIFEKFSEGFLGQTYAFLRPIERENLLNAGMTMSFMLGLRFLTDFLFGDKYFPAQYPLQNLNRARVQFAKIDQFIKYQSELNAILREIYSKVK